MALLNILKFPDPRLRIVAQKIEHIDDVLKQEVADMYDTMYDSNGVGLAATQVDIHKRLFVMDISKERDQRICVINPEITHKEGLQYEGEGCLSVGGGAYDKVKRAAKVHLTGLDLAGKEINLVAEGLMAICIQHEIDHLDGILFIDHLSRLKQNRIRSKIEKENK